MRELKDVKSIQDYSHEFIIPETLLQKIKGGSVVDLEFPGE